MPHKFFIPLFKFFTLTYSIYFLYDCTNCEKIYRLPEEYDAFTNEYKESYNY